MIYKVVNLQQSIYSYSTTARFFRAAKDKQQFLPLHKRQNILYKLKLRIKLFRLKVF